MSDQVLWCQARVFPQCLNHNPSWILAASLGYSQYKKKREFASWLYFNNLQVTFPSAGLHFFNWVIVMVVCVICYCAAEPDWPVRRSWSCRVPRNTSLTRDKQSRPKPLERHQQASCCKGRSKKSSRSIQGTSGSRKKRKEMMSLAPSSECRSSRRDMFL